MLTTSSPQVGNLRWFFLRHQWQSANLALWRAVFQVSNLGTWFLWVLLQTVLIWQVTKMGTCQNPCQTPDVVSSQIGNLPRNSLCLKIKLPFWQLDFSKVKDANLALFTFTTEYPSACDLWEIIGRFFVAYFEKHHNDVFHASRSGKWTKCPLTQTEPYAPNCQIGNLAEI